MSFSRWLPMLVLAAPAHSQNVLFEEKFDFGIPATWSQIQRAWSHDRWLSGTNPSTGNRDVFHEYFCNHGTLFRDNLLVTPAIDLRGLTNAVFSCDDVQVLPTWRILNQVEISVARGVFVPLYTVTRTSGGLAVITVDLGLFVGQADVRIAFHYQGDVANEWRIDNVRVTTTQPVHTVEGLASGMTAAFAVRGATPGNAALIGLSLNGPGPLLTPFGVAWLSMPIALLPMQLADPSGVAVESLPIPPGLTGLPVWSQGLEWLPSYTARWTNASARVVQ